jgi:iron complex outermembrane receptor protein
MNSNYRSYLKIGTAIGGLLFATFAQAESFNIPRGDLKSALDNYTTQTGTPLLYVTKAVEGVRTGGVSGDVNPEQALTRILSGTGFVVHRDSSGVLAIVRSSSSRNEETPRSVPSNSPRPHPRAHRWKR